MFTPPVEDAATRCHACPVASENGTGVAPADGRLYWGRFGKSYGAPLFTLLNIYPIQFRRII
ncbi:hypothetical protein LCGC14_2092160 [marine sediment metagenome]|uniref:Uncharacterized protein n=1 Tax=marine sediment metagenome TaxID=412755 RepID=A0A0F9ECL4_9ZZZZ